MAMIDDAEFEDLVSREVKGRATPEERAYLESSTEIMKRWRATLVGMVEVADARKDYVRTDLHAVWQGHADRSKEWGQEEWNKYRVAAAYKISRTKSFIHAARKRIVEVNLLLEWAQVQARAEAHARAVARAEAQPKPSKPKIVHKKGYYEGFGAALGTIMWLIESGCDVAEACEEASTFMHETLKPWRNNEDPDEPVPHFGRPERITNRAQV